MPRVLSTEQIEFFWEHGFCSPIDVMSEDEALSLKALIEAAEKENPEALGPTNRNNPHLTFTAIDRVAHHPIIVEAVADLLGPDLLLYGSVLFFKEPASAGYVSWHQDATYMGIQPHHFVTPWLALTPSNAELGCVRMIPGSHKLGILHHHDTYGEDNILTRGQNVEDIDESTAVDLVLKPGQMSIHHATIVHGSMPNRGTERRMGVALQSFMSPECHQTVGDFMVQIAKGCEHWTGDHVFPRPQTDQDPADVVRREAVNENWSRILYSGASQVRAY